MMMWGNKDKKAKKKLKRELNHIIHTPYTFLDLLGAIYFGVANVLGLLIEFLWFPIILVLLAVLAGGFGFIKGF